VQSLPVSSTRSSRKAAQRQANALRSLTDVLAGRQIFRAGAAAPAFLLGAADPQQAMEPLLESSDFHTARKRGFR
jgi:hypothetical protein